MITPHNITKHELIGQTVEVVEAENSSLNGIQGKVEDETKNTLTINGKKLLKSEVKIKITINEKTLIIDGKKLIGRPEERIKK